MRELWVRFRSWVWWTFHATPEDHEAVQRAGTKAKKIFKKGGTDGKKR